MTVDRKYLLNSKQMAEFAARGLLTFEQLVPAELNAAFCDEMEDGGLPIDGRDGGLYATAGTPLYDLWTDSPGFGKIIRMPQVRGIIQSLVGPNPDYDHHFVHKVGPKHHDAQIWHADAIIDTRREAFDVQLFYFAHDTPREMGGTMFLPGSQFRYISESDIARYQNFRDQLPVVCKAGTLLVGHMNLWHCAQPNHTDEMRYMCKLRLNPTVRQVRLWNTDDLDDPEVIRNLKSPVGWHGNESRIEMVNRVRFWRYLTDDARFDSDFWLTRIENEPQDVAASR
ncbi:MAG: phytanoyl-CoA dioxygenase [Planctomycetaceae bacterium]|jgi:hypothetical protein|nr:phytanoyl-CoA dioxygenase [Planctomycetaceae bacterium]